MVEQRQQVILYEAFPRGVCAGVVKSVSESEDFIQNVRASNPDAKIYYVGFPAHNTHIVNRFRDNGTLFIEHISEAEDGGFAIFGPHGSTDEDIEIAKAKGMTFLDTECPLVTKVKEEIRERTSRGIPSLYYGKRGHAETRAVTSVGDTLLFETSEEAVAIAAQQKEQDPNVRLGYAGQTTHNVDKSIDIADEIKKIIPDLETPNVSDQCYATRDRQKAAKEIVKRGAEAVIVVGSPDSSNSMELTLAAEEEGANIVLFVDDVDDLDRNVFDYYNYFGLTAGASVEEDTVNRVREVILREGRIQRIEPIVIADESKIKFRHAKVQKPPYKD